MAPERRGGPEPKPEAAETKVPTTVTTSIPRPRDARHALPAPIALEYVVKGRSGLLRTLALVTCPYCSAMHQNVGRRPFASGLRRAPCGRGSYLVCLPAGGRR